MAVSADANGGNPLALLADYLSQLATTAGQPAPSNVALRQARDDWLRRLQAGRRSESALAAYRIAIDDLLEWSGERARNVFEEATIVDYLAAYQRRARPAPATYYRRFGLLRRFFRWLSRRSGQPDPFLELEPPPKPQQEADWLTEEEFARLLWAAEHPPRRRAGLAERDRLVLLTLVQTGLRRAELIALDWSATSSSTGRDRRYWSAAARAASRAASRWRRRSRASSPACARPGRRPPTRLSSAASRASAYSRRFSPRSSVAPPSAPESRSASPLTPSATPPRPGFGRRPATRASSPTTSATPTSPP